MSNVPDTAPDSTPNVIDPDTGIVLSGTNTVISPVDEYYKSQDAVDAGRYKVVVNFNNATTTTNYVTKATQEAASDNFVVTTFAGYTVCRSSPDGGLTIIMQPG